MTRTLTLLLAMLTAIPAYADCTSTDFTSCTSPRVKVITPQTIQGGALVGTDGSAANVTTGGVTKPLAQWIQGLNAGVAGAGSAAPVQSVVGVVGTVTAGQIGSALGLGTMAGQPASNVVITGGAISAADVSAALWKASGGTTARSAAARSSDILNVRDFAGSGGAIGGASHGYLTTAAASGATTLQIAGANQMPRVGQRVTGAGTSSATVTAVSGNTVTISPGLASGQPANTRYDFWTQDDLPAFQAAQTAALTRGRAQVIYIPPDGYYLSGYVGGNAAVHWSGENFSFNIQGGIVESIDQSQGAEPSAFYRSFLLDSPGTQNGIFIGARSTNQTSPYSHQHNALGLNLLQDSVSNYTFRGDSTTVVRDLVGLSVQGRCAAGNTKCSLFGGESLLTFDAGTDGPATAYEYSVVNNRTGPPATEISSWNNLTTATFLSFGTAPVTAAQWIAGSGLLNGVIYDSSILGRAWAVRQEGIRNPLTGVSPGHGDLAYADALGHGYFQTMHVVGAPTATDVDAIGGVRIQGDLPGALDLGDSRLAAGPTPKLRFHTPTGAATDAPDLVITSGGGTLVVTDGAGTHLLDASLSSGITGTVLQATNQANTVATFGGSRSAGQLLIFLTGSGFDILQETGSQGLYVKTAGGYNAQFNADGSTTFNGPVNLQIFISPSLGGSALVAGACSSVTVTAAGVSATSVINVTPALYPGDAFFWKAFASAANQATVKVCAAVAGTPIASTYNLRVLN